MAHLLKQNLLRNKINTKTMLCSRSSELKQMKKPATNAWRVCFLYFCCCCCVCCCVCCCYYDIMHYRTVTVDTTADRLRFENQNKYINFINTIAIKPVNTQWINIQIKYRCMAQSITLDNCNRNSVYGRQIDKYQYKL